MPLLNLGKTVSNNVTGSYTPGAGLLAPLLTGAYEVTRGLGNISVQQPNVLIGTSVLWVLTFIWTDPDVSNFSITYDSTYGAGRYNMGPWDGSQNPGSYSVMIYTNNGRHIVVYSWGIES